MAHSRRAQQGLGRGLSAAVPDPYAVLGVSRSAPAWEIRAAYRTEAKRAHPDVPGGSPERFRQVREAYDLLADPIRRRDLDVAAAEAAVPQDYVVPQREERPVPPFARRSFLLLLGALVLGLSLRGPVALLLGVDRGDPYLFGPTYDGSTGPHSLGEAGVLVGGAVAVAGLLTGLVGLRIALAGPPRRVEVVLGLGYVTLYAASAQVVFAGPRWPGVFFFAVVGFVGWSILGIVLERRDFAAFLREYRHEHREEH